jgi:Carboxypeptidase regulatory-like domain
MFRLVLLLALPLAVTVPLPKHAPQSGAGGIEGLVTDQADMPIAMATVQACNTMQGGCVSVLSQPNGFYGITGLIAGRYSLWAEAKRHSSEWMPMVIVEEGKTTRQDIRLTREIPTMAPAQ